MRLLQTLVDVALAVLHHVDDGGETEFGHNKEDYQKSQQHPEQESQVGGQYGWQIDGLHSFSFKEDGGDKVAA